jgi:hypothetical protein
VQPALAATTAQAEDIDAAAASAKAALKEAKGTKLVLLCTSAGRPRRMASNLVLHNGVNFLALTAGVAAIGGNAPT